MARHGQIVGFELIPAADGHTDVDLTDVGIMQFESLDKHLCHTDIGAIYSSDLKRSLIGARIIAQHHDVPVHPLKELREIYYGEWGGMSLEDIRIKYPEELEKRQADIVNYEPPGNGESIIKLSKRILPCLRSILEEEKGKHIVFVGHGVINRVILCDALGLDLAKVFSIHQDYGCLNIIDYFDDSTLVRRING